MEIRRYEPKDYKQVAGLWKACFSGKLRPIDSAEHLKRVADRGVFLVAEEGKELVGTILAGYDGRQATIHRLAVHPEHRDKGYGTELLNTLLESLKELKPVEVNTHADPQPYVIHIYEKAGLVKADSVYMKKKIY